MRRLVTIAIAMCLVLSAGAVMAEDYGWSISSSSTDYAQNTGTNPVGSPFPIYLWLVCSPVDGMSAAEFDISTGFFAGFAGSGGALNAGAGNALLLAVGGCPMGPVLIGTLTMIAFAPGGGAVCLVPSALNGFNGTVDCSANPVLHDNAITGWTSNGTTPCVTGLCTEVAVESTTWGGVKSLYR